MADTVQSDDQTNVEREQGVTEPNAGQGEMSDLKIFWGPEICRLEYLLHLMDTGRIIDESSALTA